MKKSIRQFTGSAPLFSDSTMKDVYDHILEKLRQLGNVEEEAKKTSIHLADMNGLTFFEDL